MREQLTALSQSVSTQARAALAKVAPVIERARVTAAASTGAAVRKIAPAMRWTGRQSKRAAIGSLETVENVLLSPRGRDRVHAVTVFALIFGFAIISVDTIITGGPELIPSAQASTPHAPRVDLIASATGEVLEQTELAEAAVPAAAIEPERTANLHPTRLVSAAPPRDAAPVAELLDAAAEPVKAAPTQTESAQPPVKAGAEA